MIADYPVKARYCTKKSEVKALRKLMIYQLNSFLGKNWAKRFLKRHLQLQTVMGHEIEAARINEASREALSHWFDTIAATIIEYNIREDSYNMDGSGFANNEIQASRIIVDSTVGNQHEAQSGKREWDVTALVKPQLHRWLFSKTRTCHSDGYQIIYLIIR